jgi:ATP-dependent Lhr-like helicase
MRDCLEEAMDLPGLEALLARIEAGDVRLATREVAEPSPLAHEIVGARPWAFLDDAPLEERRARAVALRRTLPAAEAADLGALDAGAIAEVAAQAWPDPRDAEEVHDALLDLGVLPEGAAGPWAGWIEALRGQGRVVRAVRAAPGAFWVARERIRLAAALDPGARIEPALDPLPSEAAPTGAAEAALRVLRGWMPRVGPVTAGELAARLGLEDSLVSGALLGLEAEGLVLRGRFLPAAPWSAEAPHWCERSLLARVHRRTLGQLRREIEPVATADLLRFLLRWQHLAPGTRLHGTRGVAEVVGRLQGFHAPAGAWERELLPARVAGYEPGWLDQLCLSGEVAWGRLAVGAAPDEEPRRRAAPTRNAPVTLCLRQDLPWLAAAAGPAAPLGPSARAVVEVLARAGAVFLGDLAALTGRMPSELEGALWELVSAGAVTCDGFSGLRALVEPPRRDRRRSGPGGRWALLRRDAAPPDLVDRLAGQLLRRWGVLFRDLLGREAGSPPWRDLLPVLRRLEARGEIRGGRFVAGFTGEQFALPEVVPALRAARREPRDGSERVELSAADPMNLVGVVAPGERVPATLGNRVAYVDGVPAAARAAASRG